MTYSLPSLNYNYDALEPFFDKITMEIHHTKHHQAYINNANLAIEGTRLKNLSINEIINKLNDDIPTDKRNILRNNLGGHLNHSIFWTILKTGTSPSEELKLSIENFFGSISSFKLEFEKIAMKHFGSGWTWLIKNNNKLSIVSTPNQDNPLMKLFVNSYGFPIFGIDLWEHAYYLKYQNNKSNYIKSFWSVLNWDEALSRFLKNK